MSWILLIAGIILVVINIKAIKKEKSSFRNILQTTDADMEEYEVRLGEVRREFSETILELQKEIIELKKEISIINNVSSTKEQEKLPEEINNESIKAENNAGNNSVKIAEINKLLSRGLSVEEISIKLGVGKGEVLLIKDLYLK